MRTDSKSMILGRNGLNQGQNGWAEGRLVREKEEDPARSFITGQSSNARQTQGSLPPNFLSYWLR